MRLSSQIAPEQEGNDGEADEEGDCRVAEGREGAERNYSGKQLRESVSSEPSCPLQLN